MTIKRKQMTSAETFEEYARLLAEAKSIVERLTRKDLRRLITHYKKMFERREAVKEELCP